LHFEIKKQRTVINVGSGSKVVNRTRTAQFTVSCKSLFYCTCWQHLHCGETIFLLKVGYSLCRFTDEYKA